MKDAFIRVTPRLLEKRNPVQVASGADRLTSKARCSFEWSQNQAVSSEQSNEKRSLPANHGHALLQQRSE